MASLTTKLLDTLGHESVDVMGVSWGGTIAQQFAFQYPSRCKRLILAATTAGVLMIPGSLGALLSMASSRRYRDPAYLYAQFGKLYGGAAQSSPDLFRTFAKHAKPASKYGYLLQQLALAGWTSLPFLPLLRQPTLILAGDDDRLASPINSRILAKLIPNSTLRTFEDGHLFVLSRALECAVEVERFLDRMD